MRPASADRQPGILIVDDEPQVAIALADVLEDRYAVTTETSPHAALKILGADKRISVVISDQRMPGMTGDELSAQARRISTATRILITAYADISAVIDAINQGKVFAYVTKPWQPDDIILTVKRAADYCELNRKVLHERELLRQLMDSSVDAIAFKDRTHRYVRLNKYEAMLLGATDPAAIEGRSAADFLPPERAQQRREHEVALFNTGLAVRDRLEQVAAAENTSRWYSSNVAPIRDQHDDIVGLVSITRDVTEAKRLDEMKDQFIAAVRHELRTPLTAIYGSLSLLRAGLTDRFNKRVRKLVEIGYENCGRLLSLIGDLLDTVNLEKGEMAFKRALTDIPAIVGLAVEAGREPARRRGLTIAAAPGLPPLAVEADCDRLLQVLAKFVSNAIAVTPHGGEITIRAREVSSGRVRISVVDRGPGVSDEIAPLLFRRFSQGDGSSTRNKGGLGLSLHIAKLIIDAHQGTIDFANNRDCGAEFFFELPISAPTTRREPLHGASEQDR